MMWILLSVMLFARNGVAQMEGLESCDKNDLNSCADKIPATRVGIPTNKEELDAHCLVYNTGMNCIDTWVKRCVPTDGQKLLQQKIGGARAIMRFLCTNETTLRKEYLKEPHCWRRVSPDWSHCVDELSAAIREIHGRSQQLTYFNRNAELCCARDSFLLCVATAGRACSASASSVLKRVAFVLVQDVANCPPQPTYCAASPPPAVTMTITLSSMVLLFIYF